MLLLGEEVLLRESRQVGEGDGKNQDSLNRPIVLL